MIKLTTSLVASLVAPLICLSPTLLFAAAAQMQPIQEVVEPAAPASPENFVKVAVVQWAPPGATPVGADVTAQTAEAFKQQNRETLARFIREAASKGAKLIVTSEFAIDGYPDIPDLPPEEDDYRNRDDIAPYVEAVPGPTSQYFSALARELGVYIHIGMAEVETGTDKYFNAVVAVDPKGDVVAKYRKANLYQLENQFLSAGTEITTYDAPFGKVGLIVCADVYSAFPMGAYKTAKVDVLALSTSWAAMNSGMTTFSRAAKDANAFLLAANQPYFPDSGVINRDGTTQSHIRQTDGIAYGYLPLVTPAAPVPRAGARAPRPAMVRRQ